MLNFYGKSVETVQLSATGSWVVVLIVGIKSFKSFILIMIEYMYKCIFYLAISETYNEFSIVILFVMIKFVEKLCN